MPQVAIKALADHLTGAGFILSVTPEKRLKVTPSSRLTQSMRDCVMLNKEALIAWLKSESANDSVIAKQGTTDAIINSAGLASQDPSAAPAQRLRAMPEAPGHAHPRGRQKQADVDIDDRITCRSCQHLDPARRCANWRIAGLGKPGQVPTGLVDLKQRCDGYIPTPDRIKNR